MRCAKAKKWISEYIDGNLDARHGEALKRHLEECRDCMKIYQDLDRIVSSTRRLEDPEPPEWTWTRIRSRLRTARTEVKIPARRRLAVPGFRPAAAAVVFSLVVAAVLIFGPRLTGPGEDILNIDEGQRHTLTKLEEAEKHYLLAIKALGEAVSDRESQMDPRIVEVFRTNLKIINDSISACKQAVLSDPENLESRNYLLAAYQEKADLLSRIINMNGDSALRGNDDITM